VRRFVAVEGSQQGTLLAAQAFTSLIPLLVLLAAFSPGPGDLADQIVMRFGLTGEAEASARALFKSAGDTRSAVTVVSVGVLIVSATSFARVMQRMFERVHGVPRSTLREAWRALAWLAGFAVWVLASGPLRALVDGTGEVVVVATASMAAGFALWLGTPFVLLRDADWRRLVPGAAVTAVLTSLAGAVSAFYVPILMGWSAERYGLIGIALSLQSWLVVMGLVVVSGTVVGAVVGERVASRPAVSADSR
jgi:membrane protein